MADSRLLLGVDTCGVTGSVALVSLVRGEVQMLGQTVLAARTYSATLVAAVADLLTQAGVRLTQLSAIVVTSGPGSFTGVRVGLSAAKGLAEPAQIPVVAVSRLEVLAKKAGTQAAALDAHRHEVFLRLAEDPAAQRELLAGKEELGRISVPPGRVAVCDDAAADLLRAAWSTTELLLRVVPPTAIDAIALAAPKVLAGEFADLALLDGHYLRRSDAEIFGEPNLVTVPQG